MAYINFKFEEVSDSISKIKTAAELLEQESSNVSSLISLVNSGWTGAGASEYVSYLQSLQKNIYARAQNLYSIAEALNSSVSAAREADNAAKQSISSVVASSGSSGTVTGAVCPPDSSTSGAGNTVNRSAAISDALDAMRKIAKGFNTKNLK